MQITRVELQNIKSYEDAVVEFAAGTNAICGENGAGKSTLLEAIGFALFGYCPLRSQEDLLRNGAKAGSMTVAFIADDEREYEVERRFGSGASYAVHDPELGLKLVEGKADTQAWLCKRLGVPADTELPALFSDAIGVPQGLLAAVFLEGKPERHAKFDRLLRVDEYRRAKEDLLATENQLKQEINAALVTLKGLETRTERRPALEAEVAELGAQAGADAARQAALEAQAAADQSRLDGLAKLKAQLDELGKGLALLDEQDRGARRRIEESRRRLAQAQQAAADLEQAGPGHRAYLAAQAALQELEKARRGREALQAERHGAQRKLDAATQRLATARGRLEEIATAERRLAELTPLLRRQEELEEALKEAQERAGRLTARQESADRERKTLAELDGELMALDARLQEIAVRRAEADRQPALKAALDRLLDAIGSAKGELEQARKSRKAVAGGQCPFLNEACRNMAEGVSLTEFFDRQMTADQERLNGLEGQRREADAALARANAAAAVYAGLAEAREQRSRRQAARDESAGRLATLETEMSGLVGAAQEAAALGGQLRELGDQRPEAAVRRAEAGKRGAVERDIQHAEAEGMRWQAELTRLDEGLAQYAGLDEALEARRQEMREREAAYQLYLRSEAGAAGLPACEKAVGEAEAELGSILAETQRMTQERQRAAAGYDAEAHSRLEAATRAARTELASVGERLRLNGERRAALQRECEQLRALESDLETARQAFEADSELLKLTQQMRRWVSEAGPHVTRALVQEVARQAAQIYCEIMNDFTLHLHWDEHYEIKIEKAGHTRTFRQLSGGEQMAAAIAVRLALLKQVSNIDIAFFDEPTANLDETRRTSLADQIVNVRGFSQIFVISHDDTFERVTDHIVRVYKEADVSRVEVQ